MTHRDFHKMPCKHKSGIFAFISCFGLGERNDAIRSGSIFDGNLKVIRHKNMKYKVKKEYRLRGVILNFAHIVG